MIVSYRWLSEFVDLKGVTPEQVADALTFRGLEVETIEKQDRGFEQVVTARILERNQHPQADRLSLCKVTTGSATLDIVCGAQNMKAGDIVALAQIGALLPNGLKIEKSKIRGVESFGMLCSEEELKLKDESDGILILPSNTELGRPLADVLGRNDTLFHLKLTANRGDCLSVRGIAREVASHFKKPLCVPQATLLTDKAMPIKIELEAGEAAPQFYGALIEGVKIGPSPDWLKKKLESIGSRSINNVVDVTNLLLFERGHPVHAYDAEQIRGGKIGVRISKKGETLPLLDGSAVECTGEELVIFDGERSVGLAGVMGGGNSEVTDKTTRILLEVAEFKPSLIRKTASRFSKKTDASHRFERGVDPEGVHDVISRLADLVCQVSGGKVVGFQKAFLPSRDPKKFTRPEIRVEANYFSSFLGATFTDAEIDSALRSIECQVKREGSQLVVVPPSYRLDLRIREDLTEEVARIIGYDRIPETIPSLSGAPEPERADPAYSRRKKIEQAKDVLVARGFSETVNFAFTSAKWLSEFGLSSAVKIINPLSEEIEYMAPSLLPGLIRNAIENANHHFGSDILSQRLFELRPVYALSAEKVGATSRSETGVKETDTLAFVMCGERLAEGLKTEQSEVDFYDFKGVVLDLLTSLGVKGARLSALSDDAKHLGSRSTLFHSGRAASLRVGSQVAGAFGLIHPKLERALKLRAPLYIAEFDFSVLASLSREAGAFKKFSALSEFPPMERDFALLVSQETTSDRVIAVVNKVGKPLVQSSRIFDVYQGAQVGEGKKSIAVRVVFQAADRSLAEAEVEAMSQKLSEAFKKELQASIR